jgi:hypothetical protein
MSISAKARTRSQRAYVPNTAMARSAEFDEEVVRVYFSDMAGVDPRSG